LCIVLLLHCHHPGLKKIYGADFRRWVLLLAFTAFLQEAALYYTSYGTNILLLQIKPAVTCIYTCMELRHNAT
jgi:hypothetical protein